MKVAYYPFTLDLLGEQADGESRMTVRFAPLRWWESVSVQIERVRYFLGMHERCMDEQVKKYEEDCHRTGNDPSILSPALLETIRRPVVNGETRVDLAYSVTDSAGKDLLTLNGKDLAHRLAEIPHTREAALRYLETREPSLEIWIVDLIETCGVVLRSSLSDAAKKHFVHIHSYPFLLEDGINTQIIPSIVERAQMRASDLLEGITRRQL